MNGQVKCTPERRICDNLSEDQIDMIAERAAEKAITKLTSHLYQEVGKGVINRLLWVIGVLGVAVYVALKSAGWVK